MSGLRQENTAMISWRWHSVGLVLYEYAQLKSIHKEDLMVRHRACKSMKKTIVEATVVL
ncbi:hypothetical protein B9479_003714 [Cryptococcus floricola]|uniref:Uncharacterized protein n=1 Tax=Cryptococcus floricola TaxID=2591691 RepID=A0A5D3AYH4_9TREE|nr:hypothetical protein B9479_003714 [Cryptococcus floricola]